MSPRRLNSLYESNEIAVFLIRVKKKNKEKKKHERMIVVISSSKTMTVAQNKLQPGVKKITPAVGCNIPADSTCRRQDCDKVYCRSNIQYSPNVSGFGK